MKNWFFSSFGLMLILEGLMPLCFPEGWRKTLKKMNTMRIGQSRLKGLISFLLGLIFLLLGR